MNVDMIRELVNGADMAHWLLIGLVVVSMVLSIITAIRYGNVVERISKQNAELVVYKNNDFINDLKFESLRGDYAQLEHTAAIQRALIKQLSGPGYRTFKLNDKGIQVRQVDIMKMYESGRRVESDNCYYNNLRNPPAGVTLV